MGISSYHRALGEIELADLEKGNAPVKRQTDPRQAGKTSRFVWMTTSKDVFGKEDYEDGCSASDALPRGSRVPFRKRRLVDRLDKSYHETLS